MSKNMDVEVHNFNKKLGRLHYRANSILQKKHELDSWRYRYLVESLSQETWQFWNDFSKTVLVISCQGYVCSDGTPMPARTADNTIERLAYIFKKGNLNSGFITRHYSYPTWGDVSKFTRAITLLQPSNENVLLQAFGLNNLNQSILDLQKVRNCMAHKSPESYANYRGIFSAYRITHPNVRPHDFLWLFNNDGEIAYFKWLDDMLQISNLAKKSAP